MWLNQHISTELISAYGKPISRFTISFLIRKSLPSHVSFDRAVVGRHYVIVIDLVGTVTKLCYRENYLSLYGYIVAKPSHLIRELCKAFSLCEKLCKRSLEEVMLIKEKRNISHDKCIKSELCALLSTKTLC